MAEITTLREAVQAFVHDGDSVALEGFTHLIPFAAGHEILRQRRTGLTLIRLTPDIIFDQMIGMGAADSLVFSWGGNPGVGSLHRFRDAVEHGWPHPLRIEEHSHAGMANRFVAGANGLPFGVLRGYVASDLLLHTDTVASIACPFTGEQLTAVSALTPDVTIIHAQQADRHGNVAMWGITGVQKEAALAARRTIVTVEDIVDTLTPGFNPVILPEWVIAAVCHVPDGAHPSYALDYTTRDNNFYRAWDAISRDRDCFRSWMEQHVLDTADWDEYRHSLTAELKRPA
jgi:glutaconate CoA-transferase, subunit A